MAAKRIKRKKPKSHKPSKAKTKTPAKGKSKKKKKAAAKPKARQLVVRGRADAGELLAHQPRGIGAHSGGQAGDTQGLETNSAVDSESVEELLEEGQALEAEILDGVENAPDPDQSEVHTREVNQDDVPGEYLEKD